MIAALLLMVQVPNYVDLPPRPDPVTVEACRYASRRLSDRLYTYHAFVRRKQIDNGGKLTSRDASIYMNEATLAVKPYLEQLSVVPQWGGPMEDCWKIEEEGEYALGNVAGARFGEAYGYVQTPDGGWVRGQR